MYEVSRMIETLDDIDVSKLSYEDIKIVYATHGEDRSVYDDSGGHKRLVKFDYRKGYLTPIGDIDRIVWAQIAEKLIIRNFEGWITDSLQEWYAVHVPNVFGIDQSWQIALKAHIQRDFDRPGWVYYIGWNRMYRPSELEGKLFPIVVASCCDIPGETTADLMRMERRELFGYCPHCFKPAKLRLISDPGHSRKALMKDEDEESA